MPAQLSSRYRLFPMQSVLHDWWNANAVTLGYIIKVLIACLLAMWLSLRFELDQPRTAMLTVAIVMQSRAGMVFTKSFYRLLGTLVGIAVSFLLVALFAQERVLFLLYMALWIGFCTAGSMVFRNHQSYGFVLAGYTLCIVGLPATINPALTFSIGVTRISEILIGLFCATIVSDLIFPQRMWVVMLASVRRRFGDFSDLLRSAALNPAEASAAQPALLRFVGDIYSLESFRASTVLENDDSRTHRLRLSLLNAEFMQVSTSFHALEQLLSRQRINGHAEVGAALLEVYYPLARAFTIDGRSARTEHEAKQITVALKIYRDSFMQRQLMINARLPANIDPVARLDFDTGVELIRRFADELQAYTSTYASLAGDPGPLLTEAPLRLGLHFDPLAVALAGVRGTLTLALMAALWIFTDWRSGLEAITLGVITGTLFAATPAPTRTIRQFIIGAAIGTVLTYVCNFHLLPQADDFVMLALAVTPVIVLAAWMTTRPAIAFVGSGIFLIFLMHIGFNSSYSASPVTFMNDAIADFIAIFISGTLYGLIDLSNSDWSRRRIAQALRNLVVTACREPLPLRRARLENAARDLVQRSGSAQRIANAQDREVIDWLLSALEIGHAVIELREQMNEIDHQVATRSLVNCLSHIADLYAAPSTRHRMAAISAIDAAMAVLTDTVTSTALPHSALHQVRVTLHFIHSALLDDASVLANAAPLLLARKA
ncbi:MAG: FUSC family protein [Gallionella sp.]|jgi:uncharacterized membrane protein YccC